MTQSNIPTEIVCPHCRQTYAITPEQWPQYQGQSISCTKCGQTFAVGASAPGGAPPPLPPMVPAYAQPQGYGAPPVKKGLSGGAIAAIIIGILAVLIIPCLLFAISILLPALNKVRQEALKAKCASNMRNIAAAMITYSNSNKGEYPDSMVTLIRNGNLPPTVFVCPDSTDTPLTVPLSAVTEADLPGHCSYIYVAGGMNSSVGSNTVLLYESLADHHSRGINVLYGDTSVSWLPTLQAQQMIQSLPTAAPTSSGNPAP